MIWSENGFIFTDIVLTKSKIKDEENFGRMEKLMAAAKQPLMLPHCHLTPELFIKDFKGKILYIYRDVRACAASAYPFMKGIEMLKPILDPYISSKLVIKLNFPNFPKKF